MHKPTRFFAADTDLLPESLNAKRLLVEELTRTWLTATLVFGAILFLTGAALYGLIEGGFEHLGRVWTAVAFPLGWIVRHYLPGGKSEA